MKSFKLFMEEQENQSSDIESGQISPRTALRVHMGLSRKQIPRKRKKAKKLFDLMAAEQHARMNPEASSAQTPNSS